MSKLEYQLKVRAQLFEMLTELYDNTLKASRGSTIMSPEDTKMAIMALEGVVRHQTELIKMLIEEVTKLQTPKKPWYRRIFKK